MLPPPATGRTMSTNVAPTAGYRAQDEHERRSWTSVTELRGPARGIRAHVSYLNQRQRRPGAPNRHFETPQGRPV